MDYSKLCESVFDLNSDIRYVAVIDDTGTPIAGGMRGGIDSIMDENNEELYLTHTALRKSMRERFNNSMGGSRFAYVEREKISILTFYMNKYVLLVTMEPSVNSHTSIDIAEDILDMLNGKKQ
ncbi:MAG TPA: DUF6659 family protein [Nitrososphaeraceae archaeon]|jgi:hypothetical protein|nr:DUF6659 family protein [Nitrososphaeraceae archaeon]